MNRVVKRGVGYLTWSLVRHVNNMWNHAQRLRRNSQPVSGQCSDFAISSGSFYVE